MEKASRVMYSIANFVTWIIAIVCFAGIVLSILNIVDVFDWLPEVEGLSGGVVSLIGFIFFFLVAIVTIAMVRRAKAKDSSKGWDLLFMILGIIGGNIFYFLGGLFGLIAVRR